MNEIKTYKDFKREESIISKFRNWGRNRAISALSLKKGISNSNNWIRLPYYHHVFDDEKSGFERQLKYMKNFGEFISMDQVCQLVKDEGKLDGRYFCVSFDDGFYNCFSNMQEITSELDVPVIIYLPTDYIGLNMENKEDREKILKFYPENPRLVSFLSWKECNEMKTNKISFGSHTCSHANLSKLNEEEIEIELYNSKKIIEENLNTPCLHFACPWGRIGKDFDYEITSKISKKLGYVSFATTDRGKTDKGDDPFQLKRDHMLAEWENYQIRYFFSK